MHESPLLAIEGVPGVGKSSAAAALAAAHGLQVARLPDSFRLFREQSKMDTTAAPLTRLLYYLAATSHMCDTAAPDQPVIFDRWIPSVLGLVEATSSLPREAIAEAADPILRRLPQPRMTALLVADPAVLRSRVTNRRKAPARTTIAHERAATDPGFAERWSVAIAHWCEHLGDHRVVDTTNLSRHAVVEELASRFRLS